LLVNATFSAVGSREKEFVAHRTEKDSRVGKLRRKEGRERERRKRKRKRRKRKRKRRKRKRNGERAEEE
jgi:hypothetical protein